MRLARRLRAFVNAPSGRKRLALEAGWELLRARVDTLRPARHYTRHLGELGAAPDQAVPDRDIVLAAEIGHVVAVTAKAMPFRAVCLQQVLAVRRMLNRRGVRATVYLGLKRDSDERAAAGALDTAHAWVKTGDRVVNGGGGLERFVVVGTFS